jgi:hypothetical protein
MEGVDAKTLQVLLRTYDVVLSELRATGDPAVRPLIDRLSRRQAEAVAALAHLRAESGSDAA